jgi:hypothetical protein
MMMRPCGRRRGDAEGRNGRGGEEQCLHDGILLLVLLRLRLLRRFLRRVTAVPIASAM